MMPESDVITSNPRGAQLPDPMGTPAEQLLHVAEANALPGSHGRARSIRAQRQTGTYQERRCQGSPVTSDHGAGSGSPAGGAVA